MVYMGKFEVQNAVYFLTKDQLLLNMASFLKFVKRLQYNLNAIIQLKITSSTCQIELIVSMRSSEEE